jgi:hypothetical protein
MKMTQALRFVLCVLVLSAIGCSSAPKQMYEGDPRPADQVAVIHEGSRQGAFKVYEIDGRDTGFGYPAGLYVLPGTHRVKLVYEQHTYYSRREWNKELTLKAEAGHTYIPRFELVENDKMRFWFEDKGKGYPAKCLDQDMFAKKYLAGKEVPECK